MGGDCLCLPCTLEHEELGEDGDGLEENGERPENFVQGKIFVKDEAKDGTRANEVLDPEGVDCWVMCRAGDGFW